MQVTSPLSKVPKTTSLTVACRTKDFSPHAAIRSIFIKSCQPSHVQSRHESRLKLTVDDLLGPHPLY